NLQNYVDNHLQSYIASHIDDYVDDRIDAYVTDKLAADYADLQMMFDGLGESARNEHFSYIQTGIPGADTTYLFTPAGLADNLRADVKVWTESELINALGAGLTKRVTDTEVVLENNNVVGDDVTLNAHVDIGDLSGSTVIKFTPGQIHVLTPEERTALGAAERQDITYLSQYADNVTASFGTEVVGGVSMGKVTVGSGVDLSGYVAGAFLYVAGNTA